MVEEVDGASFTKHKTNMEHIIDHEFSNSSLDSLVGEAHPKDNHTSVHDDEGLGMKGDETLPLVVYEKNESHTVLKGDSNVEKSGEEVNLLQIVIVKICRSSRENPHNYNGHITRLKAKYLENGFNSNLHIN